MVGQVSGVGAPGSVTTVVPTDTSRPVPQVGSAERPASAEQMQQDVSAFKAIFGIDQSVDFSKGVTLAQLNGKVSQSLFNLIANNMEIGSNADQTITAEEVSQFVNNVAQFMSLAQLPQTDQEFVRVAKLYNKEGGKYSRVNIEDLQQIAGSIAKSWQEKSQTDPYQAAAGILQGDANQIKPVLDGISRKINGGKDYGSAGDEGCKNVLVAIAMASHFGIDVYSLYEIPGERPAASVPQSPEESMQYPESSGVAASPAGQGDIKPFETNIGEKALEDPVQFTISGREIGKAQFDAYVSKLVEQKTRTDNAATIDQLNDAKRREAAFDILLSGIALEQILGETSDEDIAQLLVQVGGLRDEAARSQVAAMTPDVKQEMKIKAAALKKSKSISEEDLKSVPGYAAASDDQKKAARMRLAMMGMMSEKIKDIAQSVKFSDERDPLCVLLKDMDINAVQAMDREKILNEDLQKVSIIILGELGVALVEESPDKTKKATDAIQAIFDKNKDNVAFWGSLNTWSSSDKVPEKARNQISGRFADHSSGIAFLGECRALVEQK